MRFFGLVLAMVGIAVILSGCGGGGGGGSTTGGTGSGPATILPASGSPYTYTGSFTGTYAGTLHLSVTSAGVVTGGGTNTTISQTFTAAGSITNAGVTVIYLTFPGSLSNLSGTLTLTNGSLTGTLTVSTGGTVTVALPKQ